MINMFEINIVLQLDLERCCELIINIIPEASKGHDACRIYMQRCCQHNIKLIESDSQPLVLWQSLHLQTTPNQNISAFQLDPHQQLFDFYHSSISLGNPEHR